MSKPLLRTQDIIDRNIPIARAIGLRLLHYGPEGLSASAPLAQNVNDKGTAFAGSIAAVATLAGWALTRIVVEEMGMESEVVALRSTIEYEKPVRGDIEVFSRMPDGEAKAKLGRFLARKGIGRWTVESTIRSDNEAAVRFSGDYVVTRTPPASGREMRDPARL